MQNETTKFPTFITYEKSESMPRTVRIESVICRDCKLPHSLNEEGKCEFCAREKQPKTIHFALIRRIWSGIFK